MDKHKLYMEFLLMLNFAENSKPNGMEPMMVMFTTPKGELTTCLFKKFAISPDEQLQFHRELGEHLVKVSGTIEQLNNSNTEE